MGIGLDLPTFVGQLVSFLILLAALSYFGYRPIRRVLEERSQRIRDSVEQVELTREEYERVRAEAEQGLKDAHLEARRILREAGAVRDRLLEEARAEAKEEARAIVEETKTQLEEQRRAVVEELRREFADAAILAAEAVIMESLDAERHRRLIQGVLEERLPLEKER
jgi:F-type H+-transporting ATPase subunit b